MGLERLVFSAATRDRRRFAVRFPVFLALQFALDLGRHRLPARRQPEESGPEMRHPIGPRRRFGGHAPVMFRPLGGPEGMYSHGARLAPNGNPRTEALFRLFLRRDCA